MTWTISHGNPGSPSHGYHSRSYGQVADWRDALLQMPRAQREMTQTLTAAAERAAAAGEPWRWS